MPLPFTVEDFYGVFREYNEAVWPVQVFLVGLALAATVLVFNTHRWAGIGVSMVLAFLWGWLAVAYHLAHFARINPLAYVFSGVSLAGVLPFLWHGVVQRQLRFTWHGGGRALAGVLLILFALVLYPAWSWFAGHRYPFLPTFGLPCPTTIFTVGILAFLVRPHPRSLYIVPLLWSIVGTQAAFLLGVPQDLGLIGAGLFAAVWCVRARTPASAASAPP